MLCPSKCWRLFIGTIGASKIIIKTLPTSPLWLCLLHIWILTHLQETAKNTSLPSLFDPLTLALSILNLFDLICLFIKKKKKHLTLYQLHIFSLTARFSCKTNTKFNFSIFYILVFLKKINPSYMYCVRLTRTCYSTCMLLHFCWFWLLL